MGQAGQVDAGDRPADVEVDHHAAAAVARRAEQVAVGLIEKEVVERFLDRDAAQGEEALGGGDRLLHALFKGVHHAGIDRRRLFVGGDLPDLRDVLERNDEAVARPRLIDRGNPGAYLAGAIDRGNYATQREVGRVQQHQRVGQVVGDGEKASVGGDRQVSGIDPGAHLGDHDQVVEVELGDPAVARGEVDEASVGRELGPAVERETARETVDRLQPVAVQDGDVMVATLDHDEEVERIGVEHRPVPERHGRRIDHSAVLDLGRAPSRLLGQRLVDESGECFDLGRTQPLGKARHLGPGAAVRDHLAGLGLAQPAQVLRQQRRPLSAQASGAVAAGAVRGVERGCVRFGRGRPEGRPEGRRGREQPQPRGQAMPLWAHGAACRRG